MTPECHRCGEPIPGTPITDPADPLGRAWCTEEHADADAEAWAEQHYQPR